MENEVKFRTKCLTAILLSATLFSTTIAGGTTPTLYECEPGIITNEVYGAVTEEPYHEELEKKELEYTELEESRLAQTLVAVEVTKAVLGSYSKTSQYSEIASTVATKVSEINSQNISLPVVYDPDDLRVASNASAEQLNLILEGSCLEGYGESFYQAELNYNVNAIALVAITKQESSMGASPLAKRQNNLAGISGYPGPYRDFDSYEECIDVLGQLIGEKYIAPEGKFYNGSGIRDVNTRYCLLPSGETDWDWSYSITDHANEFVASLN